VELGHVLADVVADAELLVRGDDLVELLVLQLLPAQRVVALDLAALLLVGVDLGESEELLAEPTGNGEGEDDLFDNAAGSSDADVFVAAGTVFVNLEPVLDAPLAE
jgi:hypothetical protein